MLYFGNYSALPIAAATTLGVSVKGDNAIGKFGTGLKYTIAGVLRLDGDITIVTHGETFVFSAARTLIRDQPFDIVHVNGIPCGFTTELGKHWEPWMYIRELYSNCVDEDGIHGTRPTGLPTEIIVRCPALQIAYEDRADFILTTAPITTFGAVEVHPARGRKVFVKGILVGELQYEPLYCYNFTQGVTLTEDRTFSSIYNVAGVLSSNLGDLNNLEVFKRLALDDSSSFEANYCNRYFTLRPEMEEWLRNIYLNTTNHLSMWAKDYCISKFGQKAIPFRSPTPLEHSKLSRASKLVSLAGYSIPEIYIPTEYSSDYFGFVHNGKVYISERTFLEGIPQLAMTLIEECSHLNEGLEDYSRAFQDHLLRKIVQIYEAVGGEAL